LASLPPTRATATLLVGLLCLIWGSTWIVIRGGLADLPPFTSAAARFLIAAAAMSALAPALGAREGGGRPSLRLALALGVFNFGVSYAIVYWSETILPSALASVLWSVFPMSMAVSAHLFLPGERLSARQALGFVVGFAGVVLLFATDLRALGPGAVPAGAVLLLSPLAATVGTTIAKREAERTSSVLANRDGMWIGAALLVVLALAFERDAPMHWTGPAIASVLYLAIAGTVVAFGLYFWLLRHVAANRMSLIAYVTPAVALLLGGLVGREPVTWFTLAGSALVIGGVALVVARRRSGSLAGQGVAAPGRLPPPR